MFLALAVLCAVTLRRRDVPRLVTVAIGVVAVTGLISAAVASARGLVDVVPATLFAVRPVEYWIALPATILLLRSADGRWLRRIDVLLAVVTVLQTAFAILQYYFGLPIGFSHAAYTRAAGLTVGPYELGAMSAVLVVYWIARGRWTLASLASIALAASISRVSLLGAAAGLAVLAVAWAVGLLRRRRASGAASRGPRLPWPRVAGQVASVVIAVVVLAFTLGWLQLPSPSAPAAARSEQAVPSEPAVDDAPSEPPAPEAAPSERASDPPQDAPPVIVAPSDSITRRLASTSVLGSWEAADRIASGVPHPRNSAQYQSAAYAGMNEYVNVNTAADAGVEASNLVRFFRWNLILDTIDDPADVAVGLGPSFVGPSVDGSYLRMLADGGVLGLLAWAVLIVAWWRRSPLWMVAVIVTFLVGALFIDIVYAQRPMVLLWMLLAVAVCRRPAHGTSAVDAPGSSEGDAAAAAAADAAAAGPDRTLTAAHRPTSR